MQQLLSTKQLQQLENKVKLVVVEAGKLLEDSWQADKTVRFKTGADPVTEFDPQIEDYIRIRLARLLPDAGFIVEEGKSSVSGEYSWIIDPIDQTKNFVGQVPLFYVQVALLYQGEPVLGVIYNPASGQLFAASKGNETKLNGISAGPLPARTLEQSIIDIDFGGMTETIEWRIKQLEKLARHAFRARISAAAYSPYLVTGAINAFVIINEKTKVLDQAPREIIMREAGASYEKVIVDGRPVIIAANPALVKEIAALLAGAN